MQREDDTAPGIWDIVLDMHDFLKCVIYYVIIGSSDDRPSYICHNHHAEPPSSFMIVQTYLRGSWR